MISEATAAPLLGSITGIQQQSNDKHLAPGLLYLSAFTKRREHQSIPSCDRGAGVKALAITSFHGICRGPVYFRGCPSCREIILGQINLYLPGDHLALGNIYNSKKKENNHIPGDRNIVNKSKYIVRVWTLLEIVVREATSLQND